MLILPVDMPNMPQYAIERDVSVFQCKSSKNKKSKSNKSKEKNLTITDVAQKIEISWFEGVYAHRAQYITSEGLLVISTVIQDTTGQYTPGAQYILCKLGVISMSLNAKHETVNGVQYVVYEHPQVYVYSTDTEQFLAS